MQTKHVVIGNNTTQRWYDNPDISDFMLAMFGLKSSMLKFPSLCLHTYDKVSKKGLNQFELGDDNKWKATELVESLSDRMLYHPILTVSTTDTVLIKKMLDGILDGIDGVNGENGIPAVIIVPILMGTNHFGTLAIKPAKNRQQSEVYYFNSLGTMNTYRNEEAPIFEFMKQRYGIKAVLCNSSAKWQTDDHQCGPYGIWFVQQVAGLVATGNLNAEAIGELFTRIWHMGIHNVDDEAKAAEVRNEQATILERLNTNFSTSISLDFKLAAKRDPNWHENFGTLSFENLVLQDPWKQQKAMEVKDCDGVDAFELQKGTQKKLSACLAQLAPATKIEDPSAKKENTGYGLCLTTIGCGILGVGLGVLSACVFQTSPNISALRMLASCFSPSETTAAVVTNAALCGFIGLITGVGVHYYGEERAVGK